MTKETFNKAKEMYDQIERFKLYIDDYKIKIRECLICSKRLEHRLNSISDQTRQSVINELKDEIELLEAELELL